MSSKRKSPPTKLDGGGGVNGVTDLSLHNHHDSLNLSIKSESPQHESESRISPHTADTAESLDYLNGDKLKSKRRNDPHQFHITEQSHSLENLLSKRRKSENFVNDDIPSLTSSPTHHHNHHFHHNNNHESVSNFLQAHQNEIQSQIKREQQNGSDNDEFNNNNNHSEAELKRELLVPSKKTMNDVLKVLTNKMRGSSIKDSRKRSIADCDDDGKR